MYAAVDCTAAVAGFTDGVELYKLEPVVDELHAAEAPLTAVPDICCSDLQQ